MPFAKSERSGHVQIKFHAKTFETSSLLGAEIIMWEQESECCAWLGFHAACRLPFCQTCQFWAPIVPDHHVYAQLAWTWVLRNFGSQQQACQSTSIRASEPKSQHSRMKLSMRQCTHNEMRNLINSDQRVQQLLDVLPSSAIFLALGSRHQWLAGGHGYRGSQPPFQ